MKPIAWYDPTNGMVSTDKDSPLFTPLGQVLPLYPQSEQVKGVQVTSKGVHQLVDTDSITIEEAQ
jgi:hypothetical protein